MLTRYLDNLKSGLCLEMGPSGRGTEYSLWEVTSLSVCKHRNSVKKAYSRCCLGKSILRIKKRKTGESRI